MEDQKLPEKIFSPTSALMLGHARVEITPPIGIYHRMWGAARHDQATGVHRPMYADLLILENTEGQERAVRLQLDLVLLSNVQTDVIARSIANVAGVCTERVLVTHSHSHAAGFFLPDRIPLPGGELIEPYLVSLRTNVEQLTRKASENMQSVVVTYAYGHCDVAANRDYRDEARGIFVTGYNPHEDADDTVISARVSDAQGNHILSVVHYACHPTTLAWDNSLLSPDFVGAMREVVQRETNVPCMFFQGACGDLGPKDGFTGDTDVADRNGRQLGFAALSALASLGPSGTDFTYSGPVKSGATIGTWEWSPFDAQRMADTMRWEGRFCTVDLPCRTLPTANELQSDLSHYSQAQKKADEVGDLQAARDAGALAERCRRWLARLADLPEGQMFPYRYSVFQFGDAVWITCSAEPYNALIRELRDRFPKLVILLSPIAGDSMLAYLLPKDRYGLGLYQEEPSCLGPGCLEKLTDDMTKVIENITGNVSITSK